MGRLFWISWWAQGNRKVLVRGSESERVEDAPLALNLEKGVMSQEMWAAFRG